jgi:hypothetical protein
MPKTGSVEARMDLNNNLHKVLGNNIKKFISYLRENTLHHQHKDKQVNVDLGKNLSLSRESL